eukprot:TRINITY_DN7275_c1_g1_i1.p1 TRINITY_DN7275_c1_g1~~TRINITY_DN7275_c1_g1_i1.p1  ORF type:complete len:1429 (+),score=318.23 TRINITY_DN7275_c1_g1_i1:67-4353(+)
MAIRGGAAHKYPAVVPAGTLGPGSRRCLKALMFVCKKRPELIDKDAAEGLQEYLEERYSIKVGCRPGLKMTKSFGTMKVSDAGKTARHPEAGCELAFSCLTLPFYASDLPICFSFRLSRNENDHKCHTCVPSVAPVFSNAHDVCVAPQCRLIGVYEYEIRTDGYRRRQSPDAGEVLEYRSWPVKMKPHMHSAIRLEFYSSHVVTELKLLGWSWGHPGPLESFSDSVGPSYLSSAPLGHVICSGCGTTCPKLNRCPKCIELKLPPSYFCSQECFKESWKAHKKTHASSNIFVQMADLENRFNSFKTWPYTYTYATPRELSKAGYFYQPTLEYPDRCVCFKCEGDVRNWSQKSVPWLLHKKFKRDCPLVKEKFRDVMYPGEQRCKSKQCQFINDERDETCGMCFMPVGGEKEDRLEDTQLSISVMDAAGEDMCFKIKKRTPLKKLTEAYCNKQAISRSSVRFVFGGSILDDSKTPDDLKMEDEDFIDVMDELSDDSRCWHLLPTSDLPLLDEEAQSLPEPKRQEKFKERTTLLGIWPSGEYVNKPQMLITRKKYPVHFTQPITGRVLKIYLQLPKPEDVYIPQVRIETDSDAEVHEVFHTLATIFRSVADGKPPRVSTDDLVYQVLVFDEGRFKMSPINMLQSVGFVPQEDGAYCISGTDEEKSLCADFCHALEEELRVLEASGADPQKTGVSYPWEQGSLRSKLEWYAPKVLEEVGALKDALEETPPSTYLLNRCKLVWSWSASYWYFEHYSVLRSTHKALATQIFEAATQLLCAVHDFLYTANTYRVTPSELSVSTYSSTITPPLPYHFRRSCTTVSSDVDPSYSVYPYSLYRQEARPAAEEEYEEEAEEYTYPDVLYTAAGSEPYPFCLYPLVYCYSTDDESDYEYHESQDEEWETTLSEVDNEYFPFICCDTEHLPFAGCTMGVMAEHSNLWAACAPALALAGCIAGELAGFNSQKDQVLRQEEYERLRFTVSEETLRAETLLSLKTTERRYKMKLREEKKQRAQLAEEEEKCRAGVLGEERNENNMIEQKISHVMAKRKAALETWQRNWVSLQPEEARMRATITHSCYKHVIRYLTEAETSHRKCITSAQNKGWLSLQTEKRIVTKFIKLQVSEPAGRAKISHEAHAQLKQILIPFIEGTEAVWREEVVAVQDDEWEACCEVIHEMRKETKLRETRRAEEEKARAEEKERETRVQQASIETTTSLQCLNGDLYPEFEPMQADRANPPLLFEDVMHNADWTPSLHQMGLPDYESKESSPNLAMFQSLMAPRPPETELEKELEELRVSLKGANEKATRLQAVCEQQEKKIARLEREKTTNVRQAAEIAAKNGMEGIGPRNTERGMVLWDDVGDKEVPLSEFMQGYEMMVRPHMRRGMKAPFDKRQYPPELTPGYPMVAQSLAQPFTSDFFIAPLEDHAYLRRDPHPS